MRARDIAAVLIDRDAWESRFWRHVNKTGTCWVWTGIRGRKGYGQFAVHGGLWPAHRLAYGLAHGPPAVDLHVMHQCDNPPCVNPDHLRLGTAKENAREASHRLPRARGAAGRVRVHRFVSHGRKDAPDTDRHRIVVPQRAIKRMGWKAGDRLEVTEDPEGILLRPVRKWRRALTTPEAIAATIARNREAFDRLRDL